MLLYMYIMLLMVVIYISYIKTKDMLSPPVVFSGALLISSTGACLYENEWSLNIGLDTFYVLLMGTLSFILGFFFFSLVIMKRNRDVLREDGMIEKSCVSVSGRKTLLFIFLEIIAIGLLYQVVDASVPGGSIPEKIGVYRVIKMSDKADILAPTPRYVSYLTEFCTVGSFFYLYLLVQNYFKEKKINKLYIVILLLSMGLGLVYGSRGPVISIIAGSIAMYSIFLWKENRFKFGVKLKVFLKLMVWISIVILLFPMLKFLTGRSGDTGDDLEEIISYLVSQIAIYVSAPVKLLDLLVESLPDSFFWNPDYIGSYTFYSLYNNIATKFNLDFSQTESFKYGFQVVNGYQLGNVYTMFGPLMIDFRFFGMCLFSAIMGMIIAYIYYRCRYSSFNVNGVYIWVIVYAFCFRSVMLPFFAPLFFMLLVPATVHYVVFGWLFVKTFCRKEKMLE